MYAMSSLVVFLLSVLPLVLPKDTPLVHEIDNQEGVHLQEWMTSQGDEADTPSNNADAVPSQCGMVSQIQSVVIQILSTHYEYGKGIHVLHALVDNIQNDIAALKADVKQSEKSCDELASRFGFGSGSNLTSKHSQPLSSSSYLDNSLASGKVEQGSIFRTVQTLQYAVLNITKTVGMHGAQIARMDKRHRSLRRTLTKVMGDMEKWRGAAGSDGGGGGKGLLERGVFEHFLEKQKEMNANLVGRVRYLEERVAGRQYARGSNALVQGDAPKNTQGCPEGFQRHFLSCYLFANVTKSWVDAEKHCQTLHQRSHLVAIETYSEQQYLNDFRSHNNAYWTSAYIWTGGTDMYADKHWTWVGTGRPLSYTNWRPGEPNKQRKHSHCIYFRTQGTDNQWDDWHCNAARLNFVCEIQVTVE